MTKRAQRIFGAWNATPHLLRLRAYRIRRVNRCAPVLRRPDPRQLPFTTASSAPAKRPASSARFPIWAGSWKGTRSGSEKPIPRAFVPFLDVTDRLHAERRKKLLLKQLNHRVKNNLAIIQALAAQTFQGANCEVALATFDARVAALSTVHDVLTRQSWSGADVGDVVRGALAAWVGGAEPRVHIAGTSLRLRPTAALALTLALHELATNASKYGALSNEHGRVDLRWRVPSRPRGLFRMTWRERGGPPVQVPSRRGFGSWLIETGLAEDLGGQVTLAFEAEGVTCNLEAPLAEIREQVR